VVFSEPVELRCRLFFFSGFSPNLVPHDIPLIRQPHRGKAFNWHSFAMAAKGRFKNRFISSSPVRVRRASLPAGGIMYLCVTSKYHIIVSYFCDFSKESPMGNPFLFITLTSCTLSICSTKIQLLYLFAKRYYIKIIFLNVSYHYLPLLLREYKFHHYRISHIYTLYPYNILIRCLYTVTSRYSSPKSFIYHI